MSRHAASKNPLALAMDERDLQEQVRALATGFGLKYYHVTDSRRTYPGYPDVVCVGPSGVLWRELKTEKGMLTEPQRAWGEALREAGQDWDIWRPTDLLDGTVARELDRLRKPQQKHAQEAV